MTTNDRTRVIERLRRAVDDHDLEAVVACFGPDYRNDTPVHPGRSFTGHDQVRANWAQIFGGVPDVRAQILRSIASGDEVWSEWEMNGTRRDGTAHHMAGVVIFGVEADAIRWARFYLEPVDPGADGVDAAVARQVGAG
jgi:ketosteroid isomerase-like protein